MANTPDRTILRAVFVTRASPEIGGGHVVRCLALAKALAAHDWSCCFVVTSDSNRIVPMSGDPQWRTEVIDEVRYNSPAQIGRLVGLASLLVIDDYDHGAAFEGACRSWADQILAIDDLADRGHDADLLVDSSPAVRIEDYRALVPRTCKLLLGSDHAILRPEFPAARDATLLRRASASSIARIFVSLGATDPARLTGRAVAALRQSGLAVDVDLVLGVGDAGEAVDLDCGECNVTVHRQSNQIHALMSAADLAIGTAGLTAFERCCLGLPSISIIAADNQRGVASALERAGALIVAGDCETATTARLASAIVDLAGDHKRRATMASKAAAICDGRGADRIVAALGHGVARDQGGATSVSRH